MLGAAKRAVKSILNRYPQWMCRQDYDSQAFTRFNERPVEFSFVFRKIGEIYPRSVLDVGTGTTALPHLMHNCGCVVTATDNIRDYWPAGMLNRHWYVVDDDITNTGLRETFDLVTCISVLEHIKEPDKAVKNLFRLLKPDGHLILTFPYSEQRYVRNVYDLPRSSYGRNEPYIAQSYSKNELDRWLHENHGKIIDQEYWQFWEGDYWTVGKQVIPPRIVAASDRHQLTCILMQKCQ